MCKSPTARDSRPIAAVHRFTELVLSCREPPTRKKGQNVFPSAEWQEVVTAQAFVPPSWLGHADDHGFSNVAESLVTYEVDVSKLPKVSRRKSEDY